MSEWRDKGNTWRIEPWREGGFVSYCAICGEEAFVGVGSNPIEWLCMTHFSLHMKELKFNLDKLRSGDLGGTENLDQD